MKRLLFAFLSLVALSSLGCAEFDGYYEDDSYDSYRRGYGDERGRERESRNDDRSGAYGGVEGRR